MKLYLPALVAAVLVTLYAGANAVPTVSGVNYDARNGSDWETSNSSCKSFSDVYHDMLTLQTFTDKIRVNSLVQCDVASLVLQFAASIGVKVDLGLTTAKGRDYFLQEKAKLGEIIAKDSYDTVVSVHVGSGAISRDNVTVETAISYMNEVRDFIRSHGKNTSVTITDTIDLYNSNPQLLEAVDYVSVGYSPFWERVDVNEGVAVSLDRLRELRKTAANKDKSVVISETDWSSGGTNPVPDMASPANQAKYFSDFVLMAHSHKDLDYYWSEAFDATWLNQLDVEAHLGVYLKAGQMKDDIFKLENNWRTPSLIRTEGSIMLSEFNGELYMSEKSNEWLTQEQQTWFFDFTTQQIRSKSSDRCLDAYQPWDGGKVHVYRCMDNEPNQKWMYDNALRTLQHATHKGFCLDQDSAQNNKVQLYGCSTNNTHQQWEVIDPNTLYCQAGSFCSPNEQ